MFAGGPGVLDGPLDPADAIASVDPGFYPWWQNANRGAGDVDGDGVNDLVFLDNGTGEPVVFLGPLVGALDPSDAVTVLVAGGVEHALDVVGDLDGDGDEEIVGVGDVGGTPSLRVLHVDAWVGSRVATTPDDWVAGPGLWWQQPVPHRVGDVDGDGAVDLVFSIPVAGHDADLALVPGPLPPGSGRSLWTVSRRALLRTPLQLVHAVSAADLDLDGDQEVLVHRMAWDQGYYVDPEIDVLDGPWSGSTPVEDLALARIVPGAEVDPRAVVAPGDLDGDGIPDLLVGASGASVARPCTLRPEQPWREASVHPGAILFLPGPVEGLHVLALERALWGPYRTAWVGAEVADVGDVEPGGSHEVVATAWPTYARDVLLRVPTCAR